MRAAAAPQQQPRFRRLAAFQGVSAFGAPGEVGREGARGGMVTSARATCGMLRRP